MTGVDFEALFDLLSRHPSDHRPSSSLFRFLGEACPVLLRAGGFGEAEPQPVSFGPFGSLTFPFVRMGAVDTIDLFGLHELVIFAFYAANRGRYARCVDIGANLGLHSILLARCGSKVRAYEPDPIHAGLLRSNLDRNHVADRVELVSAAVSDRAGEAQFIRVKGNTTGSHLAGAKRDPYGALDLFDVAVHPFHSSVQDADFVKIDAEGHEVVLLTSLPLGRWHSLDAMVEIGTAENAKAIWDHFAGTGINLFSQKIGWTAAKDDSELPHGHRDGSVFISHRPAMPWSMP